MSLIGLDIGTTGCKAIVFSESGDILAQASREYPVLFPRPLWAEQDADKVFSLAMQSLTEAAQQAAADPPTAMAISCQGEAIIAVSKIGSPLRHAILGMDTRTEAENTWLEKQFNGDELFRRTGMPLHTVNTLPKLLWLQNNEPEIWNEADQFLLYEDFFIRRLTGKAIISHCLASRTQMYDLVRNDWADDILEKCGVKRSRLACLAPENASCGMISAESAHLWGLPVGLQLFAGGHDQACAALGSGVVKAGMAMVSTGTAEVIEVAMEKPALHPSLRLGNISVYRHVVSGLYLAMTLNHSGGLSLRWFRDTFAEHEIERARDENRDAYDLLLNEAGDGPTNLFVLPHFSGSGTPNPDSESKGAVLGLTFTTGKGDIAKAILEGLCFELRLNIEMLKNAGIKIADVYAVGGGAKSPIWLQMKADICDLNLHVPSNTESACRGSAMLASVGLGVFPDASHAAKKWITYSSKYQPDNAARKSYNARFDWYKKLYPLLKDINHALST